MIFAEIKYSEEYSEVHDHLVMLIKQNFKNVESGLQGDSWIWVIDGETKVSIDTFSSMNHQIKSNTKNSPLLKQVLNLLSKHYELHIYSKPEYEAHEE